MTSFLLRDIPKPLHAKLKQLAKRQRRTMRQMMFVVLEEAVDKSEPSVSKANP